jgi:Caspase domain
MAFLCPDVAWAAQATRGLEALAPQAPAPAQLGDFYALVIGIDSYQPPLSPLKTAVNDAQAVGDLLHKGYGFQVQYLLDKDATRFNILDALARYEGVLKPDDSLLVYYAGHGYLDPGTRRAYWMPVDANSKSSPNRIISDDLMNEVSDVPARHVLVISDSCYSGDLASTRGVDEGDLAGGRATTVARMLGRRSRNLMASGGDEPVSDAGGSDHSLFAAVLLRSLAEDDHGMFTASGLFYGSIKDLVVGKSQQTPEYAVIPDSAHDGGDFVFVRTGKTSSGAKTVPSEVAAAIATAAAEPLPSRANSNAPVAGSTDLRKAVDAMRMTVPNIGAALASGDVKFLKDVTAAGISSSVIEEALRQKSADGKRTVAQEFFQNASNSQEAMDWLNGALGAGLDPNMTLPSDYYEQEGLLTAAMRASNPAAVKLLLKHGASPHAYQNLFLTSYPEPRFLYPLQTIAQDDRMDLSEKQALTKAFLDAGAVVPDPAPINPSGKAIPIEEAQQIQTKTASALGMKLPPSPLCCKTPGPICKEASQRTGEDWCSIVAKMPTRLNVDFSKKPDDGPIWDVELRYLLGVSGNKAYFMGLRDLHSSYTSVAYVLIEVSKDASSWTVLSFMAPQAGMGICKKDEPGDTGEPPEYCWRRIPIHRIAGTDQMRFDQWDLTWNIQK